MQASGIDALMAVRLDEGQALVTARARCRQCLHESECRNWLESAAGLPLPPDFCPNASFFQKCGLLGLHRLGQERHLD